MKPEKNEQWLLDGKCSICRRKNYCNTQCTKSKHRQNALIHGAVFNAMMNVFKSKK